MGGRMALAFNYRYPDKIIGLVLESTSFGIESEQERVRRINADKVLSEKVASVTIEEFINYWMNNPLFGSLKNLSIERFNELRNRKIRNNNKIGLKNSLLGFGTGKMKYYLPELDKIKNNVLLISGELDPKYCSIAEKAREQFSSSELIIIKNTGHNIHFENPEEFLKLLNRFLLNIRKNR